MPVHFSRSSVFDCFCKQQKIKQRYDKERNKNRNQVERFFNRIKQYLRVPTRYKKAVENFAGCIWLVALMVDVL